MRLLCQPADDYAFPAAERHEFISFFLAEISGCARLDAAFFTRRLADYMVARRPIAATRSKFVLPTIIIAPPRPSAFTPEVAHAHGFTRQPAAAQQPMAPP